MLAVLERCRRGWRSDPAFTGALLFRRKWAIHTLTAARSLDVAWCCRDSSPEGLVVARVVMLGARRVALGRPGAAAAVVASGGAFERWGLQVGDRLEVKGL